MAGSVIIVKTNNAGFGPDKFRAMFQRMGGTAGSDQLNKLLKQRGQFSMNAMSSLIPELAVARKLSSVDFFTENG